MNTQDSHNVNQIMTFHFILFFLKCKITGKTMLEKKMNLSN